MHRRHIFTEDKAKVIAAVQFLAALAVLHQDDIKKERIAAGWYEEKDGFILFFKSSWWKIASAARSGINVVPQTSATTLALSSV